MGNPGRPPAWETVIKPNLTDIESWIAQGVAEYTICQKLGISTQPWYDAKNKYPEFYDLVMRARGAAGSLMLAKQYAAASGHTVKLVKQKVSKDGELIDAIEEQYIPPNVQSAEFWGRHLMPGYIAPRSDGAAVTVNVQLPQISDEVKQLADKRRALEQELADIEINGEVGDPIDTEPDPFGD